jgi:uncharacterized membrane protein
MRVASRGQVIFAATLIGLGILGLIKGDFTPVWEPVPKGVPAREALAFTCACVSLASGAALLWPRTSGSAARLLLGYLLLWMLAFRVPELILAPARQVSWSGCGETAVVVAGAWVLYAWFAPDWDRQHLAFASGEGGVHIARVLYGLALIPFGLAHFVYARETAALVPVWLPAHMVWAYITGCAFLAGGTAILVGVCARLAAALSALQMGLFTVLVWLPIVAAGSKDPSQWSEAVLSVALTAGGWVVADSYRGMSWFATNKR